MTRSVENRALTACEEAVERLLMHGKEMPVSAVGERVHELSRIPAEAEHEFFVDAALRAVQIEVRRNDGDARFGAFGQGRAVAQAVKRMKNGGMMGEDDVRPLLFRLFHRPRREIERAENPPHRSAAVEHHAAVVAEPVCIAVFAAERKGRKCVDRLIDILQLHPKYPPIRQGARAVRPAAAPPLRRALPRAARRCPS